MVCGLKLTRIFLDVVCLSNDINMQICIFHRVDVKNKLVHDKHSGDLVRFVKQAVGCWSLRMCLIQRYYVLLLANSMHASFGGTESVL